MEPGSISILFRNDHFSTLYRHPQTHQLFGLVTDAGFAGHDEVVWESLVDVSGENAEFFSGDFRLVGGALHGGQERGGDHWGRRRRGNGGAMATWGVVAAADQDTRTPLQVLPNGDQDDQPLSPSTEQEDRDLALHTAATGGGG